MVPASEVVVVVAAAVVVVAAVVIADLVVVVVGSTCSPLPAFGSTQVRPPTPASQHFSSPAQELSLMHGIPPTLSPPEQEPFFSAQLLVRGCTH